MGKLAWAARLAAKREFELMQRLYSEVSVPKPVDHNCNVGWLLLRGASCLRRRCWTLSGYLDRVLEQVGAAYEKGVVHGDLSKDNVFVSDARVTFINWSQYVEVWHERDGGLLEKDVRNVLAFFWRGYEVKQGLDEKMKLLEVSIWRR